MTPDLSRHGWRAAFIGSAVVTAAGGSMHPDAEASLPIGQEMAVMTADSGWVPGHTLLSMAAVLLATGLWLAARQGVWPRAGRVVRYAAIAASLYVVETVVHLASAVDTERLAAGETAPTTYTHLGLALVLYPVTGLTLAWLAWTLARREWHGAAVALAVPGVVGGLAHAMSVPLTFAVPDTEVSPIFAVSGMLLAAWSLALGLVGIRSVASSREVVVAA